MKKLLLLLLCVPLMFSCGENNEKGLSACDCADYAMEVVELGEKKELESRKEIEEEYKHLTEEEYTYSRKIIEGSYKTKRTMIRMDVRALKEKLEKEFTICQDLSDESQTFLDDLNDCYLEKINKYQESNGELNPLNKELYNNLEIVPKRDNKILNRLVEKERISEDELTESENRYYYQGKLFNGISELYDEHGGLWKEWNYKDGQRNGLYKRWSESGRLKHEGNYKNGQLNGVFKVWHRSSVGGQLRYEFNYKDGEIISKKCWDEQGNEIECE